MPPGASIVQEICKSKKSLASSMPKSGGKPGQQIEQDLDQLYISRKSKALQRVTFNDSVNKIPGIYNEKGIVAVQSITKVQSYDFLNLTAAGRVQSLDKHFEVIQNAFK